MWISLLLPKIEDGNNFGVAVQESAICTSMLMELEAGLQLNDLVEYFTGRANKVRLVLIS